MDSWRLDPNWDRSHDQYAHEKPLPPYVFPFIKQQKEKELALKQQASTPPQVKQQEVVKEVKKQEEVKEVKKQEEVKVIQKQEPVVVDIKEEAVIEKPPRTTPMVFDQLEVDKNVIVVESQPKIQNSKVIHAEVVSKPKEDYPKFELPQKQFSTDPKSIQYYLKNMNKNSKMREFLQNSDDAKLNGCVINWCGGVDGCKDYTQLSQNVNKCINMLYRPQSDAKAEVSEQNQEQCIMQCQLNEGMTMDNANFLINNKKKFMQESKGWMNQKTAEMNSLNNCILNSDNSWKYFKQEAFTENNGFEVNKFLDKQISDCFEKFKPKNSLTKCQVKCMFDRSKAFGIMKEIKNNFSNELDTKLREELAKRFIN